MLIVLFSGITLHTGLLLLHCQNRIKHDNQPWRGGSYPDIGEAAFGRGGRVMVGVVLYAELFCCLCLFLILLGTNLHRQIPEIQVNTAMAYAGGGMIPLVLLRDMSILSYLSMCGIIATLGLCFMVVFAGLSGQVDGPSVITHPEPTRLFRGTFPLSFGLIGFCFSGHAVFPSVYKSMREPDRVPVMLYMSYALVTLAYCSTAAVGYLHYGQEVKQQVTMSFQPGMGTTVVTWLIVVNGVTKFVLTLAPLAMGVEEIVEGCVQRPWLQWTVGSGLRIATVGLAYMVASKVTFFAYVASFIGALMSMLVSVIFPALCYLRLFREEIGTAARVWNWLVVLTGVVAAAGGTYAAVAGVAGA